MSAFKDKCSRWAGRLAGRDLPVPVRNRLLARATVLLLVLGIVKLVLLLGSAGHLYQTHWRTGPLPPYWFSRANFYLFTSLVLATFIELGRQSAAYAKRDIRWLNLWFVLAGLAFVFFSLHSGTSNYIEPIQDGTLGLLDLRWYLNLNLFFGKPWLAVYLILYPLIYYGLVSARREGWSFYVLGGIAAFYLLANLQELMLLGRGLLVVNCFGLGALLSLRKGRSLPGWWPFLVIAFLVLGGWLLFAVSDPSLYHPAPGLILILLSGLLGWACVRVLTRRSTVFPVLSHLLPFYLAAFCLLSVHHFRLANNYHQLLLYSLATPHYFWQEIAFTLALLVVALALSRSAPRAAGIGFDILALFLVMVTMMDFQLVRTMGFRIDWSVVTITNQPAMLWRTVKPFVGPLVLLLAGLVPAYYAGVWLVARLLRAAGKSLPFRPGRADALNLFATFACIVCVSPLLFGPDKVDGLWPVNIVRSHPFVQGRRFQRIEPAQFVRLAQELRLSGIPPRAPVSPAGPEHKLNVFLIVMESSYNRYLSLFGAADDTQPLLKKYRDRMELFPNFYSVFPNSFHGRFAVFSGLYPTREYVSYLNPRLPVPSLFEILHDRGCRVTAFDSCFGDYARLNDYLNGRKIDVSYDAYNMPGRENSRKVAWGLAEEVTMAAIKKQFTEYAAHGDRFFVTYTPVAPHMPFDLPDQQFKKFKESSENSTSHCLGRYKNQLLYMDWVITSLLDALEELHLLDDTLVLITNDHGEMLGDEDDGQLGHGWNLKPVLANTPLIILNPRARGHRVNYTPGSQVDVLPTVLDLLNVPLPPGELYQGVSLYDASANSNKVVYLNSYQDRAVVVGGRYILNQADGNGPTTVFNISNDVARTIYEPTTETNQVRRQLDEFERLQNSLIVNYSWYRDALKAQSSTNAAR